MRRALILYIAIALFAATAGAAPQIYPPWFPQELFTINPDNTTVEEFGTDTFKVKTNGTEDSVEVKGKHYAGSLYPLGPESGWDAWKGTVTFKTLQARLEKQGFKIVWLNGDN